MARRLAKQHQTNGAILVTKKDNEITCEFLLPRIVTNKDQIYVKIKPNYQMLVTLLVQPIEKKLYQQKLPTG